MMVSPRRPLRGFTLSFVGGVIIIAYAALYFLGLGFPPPEPFIPPPPEAVLVVGLVTGVLTMIGGVLGYIGKRRLGGLVAIAFSLVSIVGGAGLGVGLILGLIGGILLLRGS